MTGLLVSVRSASEAETALAGGADIVDIKEPRRGALGPADPQVWREVQQVVRGRVPTSAALGELLDTDTLELAEQTHGLSFAKFGLAGCHAARGWIARWYAAVAALPPGTQAVPVAYADWPAAGAPSPSVALTLAAQLPARLLLIDTFDKSRGRLLNHLPGVSLAEFAQLARQMQVRLVLAGSLDAAAIDKLLSLAPACFGVRGAACRGGRDGTLDPALVKSLACQVHSALQRAAG